MFGVSSYHPRSITYAVSQNVIDIIESIEPGVHQYLPYELFRPDGTPHPDKRWLLNNCARAERFDWERPSVVQIKAAPHFYGDFGPKNLFARAKAVSDRAMWTEYRYNPYRRLVLSDAFLDALNAAGCRGWQPAHADLGKRISEV